MRYSQGGPLRIGLTGGIGSGKTTACRLFSELGVPVIDADQIAHELTQPGQPATRNIIETFGQTVSTAGNAIDRVRLRQIIFNDPQSRKKLEEILHPMIYAEIDRQAALVKTGYCVIAIPLLFETHAENRVDRILVIDAPEELQARRASERDGTDVDTVRKVIKTQVSREKRLDRADDIIHNDGDIEALRLKLLKLHEAYKQLTSAHQAHTS